MNERIDGNTPGGEYGLSRRRLLKLAAYSVPAASVLSVSGTARALFHSPPAGLTCQGTGLLG